MAWQTSRGRPGFVSAKILANTLADDLAWGTAATTHAISWPHIDDEGFGTVASIQVGSKYWVVARPKRNRLFKHDDGLGHMDTINAFGISADLLADNVWEPASDNTHLVDYEGILLTPDTVL